MDSAFESGQDWDLGRPVSPNIYRHTRDFSDQSAYSTSSYGSGVQLFPPTSLSRTTSHRKPPKQRLNKLIKSGLKHTLASNNTESTNLEYWSAFYKKLRKILHAFNDPLALYDALNDPYSGKSSKKTCSSLIHLLCKMFYLYSRSSQWSICFKIWDSIEVLLDNGANTSIFYTKLDQPPQKNYNSLHTLYKGLHIMLENEVITHQQFANYFSVAIACGNQDVHDYFVYSLQSPIQSMSQYLQIHHLQALANCDSFGSLPSISNESSNHSQDSTNSPADIQLVSGTQDQDQVFHPAVLTLCIYQQSVEDDDNQEEDTDEDDSSSTKSNGWQWQNITYWMADCLYHDYYVNLISPHLAKQFIMMGYDLLHVAQHKLDHLDYHSKQIMDALICDSLSIQKVVSEQSANDDDKLHCKVVSFLWFIRFGNFKSDLVNILHVGISQLARNEFEVDTEIIEEILSYSHHFIMSHSESTNNADIDEEGKEDRDVDDVRETATNSQSMDKLTLSYFDEDRWMMTAFEALFKLDNVWIDWIGQYVMPQLTTLQIEKIKQNLSQTVSDKEWNKFIRRISLQSINAFCKHDIFGEIDATKMQNIINANYRNPNIAPIISHANYDIEQVFGNSGVLYQILNDDTVDETQIDALLHAIHDRIDKLKSREIETKNNSERYIINDLLFGAAEWKRESVIWKNIKLVFVEKYKHFCCALNDLFYELTTQQHHAKFAFFMKNGMMDFQYCLNGDLIESGLQNLMNEAPFDQQAMCIQLIGDWIYENFENEKDSHRKKEIANKAVSAITANMTNILSGNRSPRPQDRDQVIIEQYLDQLKVGLSR